MILSGYSAGGGYFINTQEFDSLSACERAKTLIEVSIKDRLESFNNDKKERWYPIVECTPKNY